MSQLKFGSAGVTAREIDLSGPLATQPVGVPAGIIGTALKGPAFVPLTVGTISDFYAKFGKTDGEKFGPLAVAEWLRNARAVTYLRVLGVGDGLARVTTSLFEGAVNNAGFTVGEQQPLAPPTYTLGNNPYANQGITGQGPLGRTYFLGCFMSASTGSTIFSDSGLYTHDSVLSSGSVPIIRGVVMAPSGVILRLSSSWVGDNSAPASSLVVSEGTAKGYTTGSVVLTRAGVAMQEFVMLLNGHKGTDALYPNVLTASFDMTAPNYFANVFNTDPLKMQQAGHYLYAHWDIHPVTAYVTG